MRAITCRARASAIGARASSGTFGVWLAGALRPGVTEAQLAVLRALSPSGDWNADAEGFELCAGLMVNRPGFPVAREALAASGDVKGAVAAFGRALELEPENRDARKRLDSLRGRTAKKPA